MTNTFKFPECVDGRDVRTGDDTSLLHVTRRNSHQLSTTNARATASFKKRKTLKCQRDCILLLSLMQLKRHRAHLTAESAGLRLFPLSSKACLDETTLIYKPTSTFVNAGI